MTKEDLNKYFEIYTDCWRLFRKYSEPSDKDAFWQSLFEEANALLQKNGKTEFSEKLILITEGEIDRIFRERKE